MFAFAKDIMDALGLHHEDSIEACQNLSKAYSAMGSCALAIKFQQQVLDALKRYRPSARQEFSFPVPSARDELTKARQKLRKLVAHLQTSFALTWVFLLAIIFFSSRFRSTCCILHVYT